MNNDFRSFLREKEEMHFNRDSTGVQREAVQVSPSGGKLTPAEAATARQSKSMAPDLATKTKNTIRGSYSTIHNVTDAENFLLEPFAMWERANSRAETTPMTRTAETHPRAGRPSSNSVATSTETQNQKRAGMETTKTSKSVPSLSYDSAQEIIDFLLQREELMRSQKTDTLGEVALEPPALRRTMTDVNLQIDSDYFLDGKELERNVVVDYATDRSYVYTTDLESKWMLPEFLFLDVPNSTYVARACGQFITNKLVSELDQMSKRGSRQSLTVLEALIKSLNKSVYEVQDIYVPRQPKHHGHGPNQEQTPSSRKPHRDSSQVDIPVQAITAKFRLRYARSGTNIHKMLYQNFMNGDSCDRGILVFIPSMEEGSPADRFWGSLEDVEALPRVDETINNFKMDQWCTDVAKKHGTYRGNDPMVIGLGVGDPHCYGPFAVATTTVSNPDAKCAAYGPFAATTTASNPDAKRAASKKPTKKAAAAKKKPASKKKTAKKPAAKAKAKPKSKPNSRSKKAVEVKIEYPN